MKPKTRWTLITVLVVAIVGLLIRINQMPSGVQGNTQPTTQPPTKVSFDKVARHSPEPVAQVPTQEVVSVEDPNPQVTLTYEFKAPIESGDASARPFRNLAPDHLGAPAPAQSTNTTNN